MAHEFKLHSEPTGEPSPIETGSLEHPEASNQDTPEQFSATVEATRTAIAAETENEIQMSDQAYDSVGENLALSAEELSTEPEIARIEAERIQANEAFRDASKEIMTQIGELVPGDSPENISSAEAEREAYIQLKENGERMISILDEVGLIGPDGELLLDLNDASDALNALGRLEEVQSLGDSMYESAVSIGPALFTSSKVIGDLPRAMREEIVLGVAIPIGHRDDTRLEKTPSQMMKEVDLAVQAGLIEERTPDERSRELDNALWCYEGRAFDTLIDLSQSDPGALPEKIREVAHEIQKMDPDRDLGGVFQNADDFFMRTITSHLDPVPLLRSFPSDTSEHLRMSAFMVDRLLQDNIDRRSSLDSQSSDHAKKEVFQDLITRAPDALLVHAIKYRSWTSEQETEMCQQVLLLPDAQPIIHQLGSSRKGNELLQRMISMAPDEKVADIAQELRHLPASSLLEVVKNNPKLEEHIPWAPSLRQLENVQARSENENNDPWKKEIEPLVSRAFRDHILSPLSARDGEVLVSFVQDFGAINAPRMLRTFTSLKKTPDQKGIPEEIRMDLRSFLGEKRLAKLKTPEAVLNELRKARREMTGALLQDKIPSGLESAVGQELLASLKGSTRFERGESVKDLMDLWAETVLKTPELASLPEGYEEETFFVKRRIRRTEGGDVSFDRQRDAIVNNAEIQLRMESLQEALRMGSSSPEDQLRHYQTEQLASLQLQIAKTKNRIASLPEKAQAESEKNLRSLEERHRVVEGLLETAEEPGASREKTPAQEAQIIMEKLMRVQSKDVSHQDILRSLSARHMREIAPAGFRQLMEALSNSQGPVQPQDVLGMRDLLVDYIDEHYLHQKQDDHQTGHPPFSPELRKALVTAWQLADRKNENPILKGAQRLKALDSGGASDEELPISLIPHQGPLRIFSGDLGDACTTSKHEALARGEFPNIHSMTFVAGRNTPQERMAGSVLFIETESEDGQSTLVVRANNPQENFIQSLDGDALTAKTLEAAINTAKRRGLRRVVVPLDGASASSSNRSEVAAYYQKNFRSAPKVGLSYSPETNFNGYDVWNAAGNHPVVEIWNSETT